MVSSFLKTACVAIVISAFMMKGVDASISTNEKSSSSTELFASSCQDCKNKHHDGFYCPSNGKCTEWHVTCAIDCKVPCETTKACSGCNSGSNCSCSECQAAGYSTYCPLANECYHSDATCGISCGSESDCVETSSCAPRGVCNAAESSQCNGTQTCCLGSDGKAFCSPYANATCCQYESLTCPSGYSCYPVGNQCIPLPVSPPAHCAKCEEIVAKIETDGCADCATLFPSYAWLCALIKKLGMCTWIENNALPPSNVCASMGFCGSEGCSCGYCRPQLYGQWCLSLPNKCPAKDAPVGLATLAIPSPPQPELHFSSPDARDSHYSVKIQEIVATLTERYGTPEAYKALLESNLGNFCVDGHCDVANLGCCLTCAI